MPDTDTEIITRPGGIQLLPLPPLAGSAFDSIEVFEATQRMARALAASNIVPTLYQGNLANCIILIDMVRRMRLPVLQVANALNIIHGRPSWASTFVIAAINSCGLFAPLRFEWVGSDGNDTWGCRATSIDLAANVPLRGSLITIGLTKAEGWYQRQGSKWPTMPEQMLMYRAGSFFGKIYAGHILNGMPTVEESLEAHAARGEHDVTPPAASVAAAAAPSPLESINAQVDAARATRRQRRRNGPAEAPNRAVEPSPAAAGPETTPPAAASPQGPDDMGPQDIF